ncbi:hypothetical protein CaCOL14_003809 [Colletotrichum acutatum]
MANNSSPTCAGLDSFRAFDEYVDKLRSETSLNESSLENCRIQICHALWGESNPDISGIGIFIGYTIEVALGFLLAVLFLGISRYQGQNQKLFQTAVKVGLEAFFDFAIYFATSVAIAVLVMLYKNDYGISTEGFGANEAHMGLALSVTCVLPLFYPVGLLSTKSLQRPAKSRTISNEEPHEEDEKENLRLLLFCLLAVLIFYPFVSKCIHTWKPSQIGTAKGPEGRTLITREEWNRIENMCFGSTSFFTDTEQVILAVFEFLASISIFLFAIWRVSGAVVRKMEEDDIAVGDRRQKTAELKKMRELIQKAWEQRAIMQISLLLVPVVLAGPLLWSVFRLRTIQAAIAERLESTYSGNDWGFGQIIGIIIFVPIFTEMAFASWRSRSSSQPAAGESEASRPI